MARLKPIPINRKYGIAIAIIVILTAIFETFHKWKEFYDGMEYHANII